MGRIRLHVALDCSGYSLETFILDNIEPGATIATDEWQSYNIIDKEQYRREITNQSKSKRSRKFVWCSLGDDPGQTTDQRNLSGTIRTEIPSELSDEYVFRFNRRKSRTSVKSSCVSFSRWFNRPGYLATIQMGYGPHI
jgi:hypothetical protein